jgi:pyruvate carboxylase
MIGFHVGVVMGHLLMVVMIISVVVVRIYDSLNMLGRMVLLKLCQNTLEECKKLNDNMNCSRCDVMRSERPAQTLPYKKKEKRR